MRLLLDTHIFLWWLQDHPRLAKLARKSIEAPRNECWVSAASIWEISVKAGLGRIKLGSADMVKEIEANGFTELPISALHGQRAGALPMHHKDPFDRLLIAQAQLEGLSILTEDPAFENYEVSLFLPASGSG